MLRPTKQPAVAGMLTCEAVCCSRFSSRCGPIGEYRPRREAPIAAAMGHRKPLAFLGRSQHQDPLLAIAVCIL